MITYVADPAGSGLSRHLHLTKCRDWRKCLLMEEGSHFAYHRSTRKESVWQLAIKTKAMPLQRVVLFSILLKIESGEDNLL